ncbi:FCS-Like Zinc finger 2-like [Apium graveolens]|uniref:FCS-Like Zinc finger 2-like n=1 Tax=Apium graveolens TaxID=4045 RepID=UPI003D7B6C71
MVKRTRIGTTLVDTDVINYVASPRQHSSAEMTGPLSNVVFSLESPKSADFVGYGIDRIGVFLEQCFRCKRRLSENIPVYMYSENAFCTPDCRGIQITEDEAKEKLIGKRKMLN